MNDNVLGNTDVPFDVDRGVVVVSAGVGTVENGNPCAFCDTRQRKRLSLIVLATHFGQKQCLCTVGDHAHRVLRPVGTMAFPQVDPALGQRLCVGQCVAILIVVDANEVWRDATVISAVPEVGQVVVEGARVEGRGGGGVD